MSIKAHSSGCRLFHTHHHHHQQPSFSHHTNSSRTSSSSSRHFKSHTNVAKFFTDLTLVALAMALLAVSGARGAPDPTTLEQALGSYTNREPEDNFPTYTFSDDDEPDDAHRRKRTMGQDSGFVRFGKRMSSSAQDDFEQDNDDFDTVLEDQFERGVRAQSGFVRFGKRKIPGGFTNKMGKRPVPGGFANKMGKRGIGSSDQEAGIDIAKRGSSGFVRFGKRMPGSDMRFGKRDSGALKVGSSYSECVAKTVAQAVDRTDLLNLLVANGCIRRRMPLQQNYVQVKKDNFVRFG